MRVLVACESSGVVRDHFLYRGHYAMSCDFLPSENGGNHYQGNVMDVINDDWDLMIAHPPCTYLSVSGMHWTKRGLRDPELTEKALDFVKKLMDAKIDKIAIENPVSIISSRIRKPDQIIHPWQFGDDASKKTCLWLKNLPLLNNNDRSIWVPGRIVGENRFGKPIFRWSNQCDNGQSKLWPSKSRWRERSRTYDGIGKAMADSWGIFV